MLTPQPTSITLQFARSHEASLRRWRPSGTRSDRHWLRLRLGAGLVRLGMRLGGGEALRPASA